MDANGVGIDIKHYEGFLEVIACYTSPHFVLIEDKILEGFFFKIITTPPLRPLIVRKQILTSDNSNFDLSLTESRNCSSKILDVTVNRNLYFQFPVSCFSSNRDLVVMEVAV